MITREELAREALIRIIRDYGRMLGEDSRRCEALLKDFCPDGRAQVHLLVIAARAEVPKQLMASAAGSSRELLVARLARTLEEDYAVTVEAARWAVECWAQALGAVETLVPPRARWPTPQSPVSDRASAIGESRNVNLASIVDPDLAKTVDAEDDPDLGFDRVGAGRPPTPAAQAASTFSSPRKPIPAARKSQKSLIVGLDIGTSKVVAMVGQYAPGEAVEIIGMGSQPSRGMERGVVVNIEWTVQSIRNAIKEAEQMSGCEIRSVYAGISGSHVTSLNSHGIVAIRDKEVTDFDVDRVLDAARTIPIPVDQKFLHVLPQEYVVDDQEGIRYPIGMSGVRLEARVHLITAAASAAQNITKCIARCGLEVDDLILQALAASHAVLTDDERELGVALIDIGAGTTDIVVFAQGAVRHTSVLATAGNQVTNDIAVALRTPTQYAEEIKLKYACALAHLASAEESIQVPTVGDRAPRRLARRTLAEVVQPRYEELFSLAQAELRRSGYEDLIAAGIVLTGGAARMDGAVELAEEIFHMPVRLGLPQHVSDLADIVGNPIHAAGVGLLIHGSQVRPCADTRPAGEAEPTGGARSLWRRLKQFVGVEL